MMETADSARRLILKLDINENDIDQLEAMSRDVEGRWLALFARDTGIKPPID